jgi:hypothetical protein
MIYNREKKCYEIEAYSSSSDYEGDTLSTTHCPMKRIFCRKYIIGANPETIICDKFLGTVGEETHSVYPELYGDTSFKILCKGPNSIEFINEE